MKKLLVLLSVMSLCVDSIHAFGIPRIKVLTIQEAISSKVSQAIENKISRVEARRAQRLDKFFKRLSFYVEQRNLIMPSCGEKMAINSLRPFFLGNEKLENQYVAISREFWARLLFVTEESLRIKPAARKVDAINSLDGKYANFLRKISEAFVG